VVAVIERARRDGGAESRQAPIGVVAVQGDFAAHVAMFERLGCESRLVRRPADLDGVAGLVLPGGESTTMLRFLAEDALLEPLVEQVRGGIPVFGTCAGLILMAREVTHPRQQSLALMDLTVERNGYGRQVDSFIDGVEVPSLGPEPVEGVFIRAPTIEQLGPAVTALGWCRGRPVLVRQGPLLACSFHPELTADLRLHRYFLDIVDSSGPHYQSQGAGERSTRGAGESTADPATRS
jgi:5'-phosphate synthase pdxT subunit